MAQSPDESSAARQYALNAKQYDFVTDDAHKWLAYIGGIGAGKSFAGALKALRITRAYPGSLGVIAAPTHPMLRDATIRSVYQVFPPQMITRFNRSTGSMILANGSEILFRSTSDPDTLRGPNLTWFWMDEAPLCGYEAWRVMKGRLRQDMTFQQGFITGTPHGEDAFYEDFEAHPQPGHKLYRASTRDNAVNLPAGFIEDTGYTGKFALQELEGLFVSFEGLVYEFQDLWHTGEWETAHPNTPRPAMRIGGVDWGYTNPSVALPLWIDGDDRVFVRDEYYQRQAGFAGVAEAILNFTAQYGITHWYCGPDEPEHIADLNKMLNERHLASAAVAAADDINPGIEAIRRQLTLRPDGTSGLRLSARCPQTRQEFRTYAYAENAPRAGKRDGQEKPVKAFDHALDALRYAVFSTLGLSYKRGHLSVDAIERITRRAPVSDIGGVSIFKKTF